MRVHPSAWRLQALCAYGPPDMRRQSGICDVTGHPCRPQILCTGADGVSSAVRATFACPAADRFQHFSDDSRLMSSRARPARRFTAMIGGTFVPCGPRAGGGHAQPAPATSARFRHPDLVCTLPLLDDHAPLVAVPGLPAAIGRRPSARTRPTAALEDLGVAHGVDAEQWHRPPEAAEGHDHPQPRQQRQFPGQARGAGGAPMRRRGRSLAERSGRRRRPPDRSAKVRLALPTRSRIPLSDTGLTFGLLATVLLNRIGNRR
jgi:hypothetical protein